MILLILFAALFVVSAAILIAQLVQDRQDDEADSLAEYYATMTDDTTNEPPASTEPSTSEPVIGTDEGSTAPSSDQGTVPGSETDVPTDTQSPTTDTPGTSDKSDDNSSDSTPTQGGNKDPGDVNIAALKKANKDVYGWIYIEGPGVNYPLIHYKNNEYYLRRNWLGQKSNKGCIYIETQNKADMSDFNTIIYGHNIYSDKSRPFFGQLDDYLGGEKGKWDLKKGYEYWKKHHTIKIYTEKEVLTYSIYAVYVTPTTSTTYTIGQQSKASKQSYVDYGIKNSVYDTGIVPTVNDRVITLSTCDNTGSYDNRIVIQAVLTSTKPA